MKDILTAYLEACKSKKAILGWLAQTKKSPNFQVSRKVIGSSDSLFEVTRTNASVVLRI